MTIRFLLGRAGSGKTDACLQAIADISKAEPLGPPLIFLVPEQATFQMERELARRCGGGTFRAQVLSFGRLAFRVLQEGKSYPPLISELGRQMILRRVLQEQAAEMSVLGRAARQPRFCLQLSAQIRELHNYQVTPTMLQALAGQEDCSGALRGKLQDIAAVAGAYQDYTAGRFTDPENTLELLASALQDGALPAGTRVWVDGFAGFTKQEFSVLAALLSAAAHVEIALCLEPAGTASVPAEDDLFHPTRDTYQRLRRLAGQAGVQALAPQVLPENGPLPRFQHCEPLAHLEAQFDCIPVEPYRQPAPAVRLVTAAGSRAEVEAVARDIHRVVREYGWRYRDIAVILRDFAHYQDMVSAVFMEYNIPCFIDQRRSAAHHPLVEFLRSALDAALTNLSLSPMIQLVKTDLLPLSRTEADRLENYVRAHGIRGARWLDETPWTYNLRLALAEERESGPDSDADGINRARMVVARHIAPFYNAVAVSGSKDISVYCRAIWQLLENSGAEARLQRWADSLTETGDGEKAEEHRQVWQGIIDLLNQTDDVLSGQKLGLQEFTQVFYTGLESLTLGLVPAGLDQVVVGSVERSRQPKLQAAYVLGLSEGDFPARLLEEGLFGDEERAVLADGGVELAETRRQKLFHEQYLSYIALTRSSSYLWVSCPLADEEGKAKRPSALFKRLTNLFPSNPVWFAANTPDEGEGAALLTEPKKNAALLLLQAGRSIRCGAMEPFWAAVYNEALNDPQTLAGMQAIWGALTDTNDMPPLAADTVRTLFGTPVKSSVSRLEQFARCPFAHFARYGLGLQERVEYRLEAPDLGTFYHAALRLFVERLQQEGISWRDLDDVQARERMDGLVDELVPRLRDEILMSTARMRYLAGQAREVLSQAVAALTEHARHSAFRPVAVELSFGRGALGPWRLPAGENDELWLYGQIDRVDLAEDNGRAYLRVIDYKTNPMDLKLGDAWHGLALQLLAYQAVVLEHAETFTDLPVQTAGAFYFGIQQPMERVKNPPPAEQTIQKTVQMDGLALADPDVISLLGGPGLVRRVTLKRDGSFAKLARVADDGQMGAVLAWLRGKLGALAGEILSGQAGALPFRKAGGQRACTYCTFMPLCRFDSATGDSYRLLTNLAHEEVLLALTAAEEGGRRCGQMDE